MGYDLYQKINSLAPFSMIGGSKQTLRFSCYDSNGSPINISSYTTGWKCGVYGNAGSIVLSKTGSVISACSFEIYLGEVDTTNLSGEYLQQPYLIDGSGNLIIPSQGPFIISPRIQDQTVIAV